MDRLSLPFRSMAWDGSEGHDAATLELAQKLEFALGSRTELMIQLFDLDGIDNILIPKTSDLERFLAAIFFDEIDRLEATLAQDASDRPAFKMLGWVIDHAFSSGVCDVIRSPAPAIRSQSSSFPGSR